MGKIRQTYPKVFKVRFSSICRWDPNSFHKIHWHWPQSVMVPINAVLKPRKEKVDKNTNDFSSLMPITIHFDGSVEPRKNVEKKSYTMELFWTRPGDIVVSKIDLKNGAVSVIPSEWEKAVVTNHFAVYEPNLEQINPKYFHLLIQARFFKEHLWRNKVGAEGRKEVKLNFFESFKVPVPPLSVQGKIVEYWEEAKQQSISAKHNALDLIKELNELLIKKTCSFNKASRSKVFVVNFSDTQQWDVKAGRAAAFISANPDFVRLGDCTEECTEKIKPWNKPEKEWPVYGVNNKEGVELSIKQSGEKFNAPYKIIKENWFFHNPTRANVGSLGKVPEVPEDAVTSPEYQVWRLTDKFLPEFMELILKTDFFLSLVAFNRVGGVKQRMYYANLAEIRLPLIPRNIQMKFAEKNIRTQRNISIANDLLRRRKKKIEQMILGTRPVE